MRIVTYNIHKARGMDGRTRIERIAGVLEEVDADIIALQEVLEPQAEQLASRLGMGCAFGEARRHHAHGYGNVVLSRWRLSNPHTVNLTAPHCEPRVALRVQAGIPGHLLSLANLHLGTGFYERRWQAARIADSLLAHDAVPHIVLGDFNEWTRGDVTRLLSGYFEMVHSRRSYPGLLPMLALDAIYCDRRYRKIEAHFHRSRLARMASDHMPLVADLREPA